MRTLLSADYIPSSIYTEVHFVSETKSGWSEGETCFLSVNKTTGGPSVVSSQERKVFLSVILTFHSLIGANISYLPGKARKYSQSKEKLGEAAAFPLPWPSILTSTLTIYLEPYNDIHYCLFIICQTFNVLESKSSNWSKRLRVDHFDDFRHFSASSRFAIKLINQMTRIV